MERFPNGEDPYPMCESKEIKRVSLIVRHMR